MQRPPSIIMFERLYLGGLLLWAVATVVFWSRTQEIMAASPQFQANPQFASIVAPIMIGSVVVTGAITLLFWWLVARQASVVGKWLVVVTEAIGAIGALLALLRLARGNVPNTPSVLVGLIVTALGVAAAVMLFRPDTRAWFGEGVDRDADLVQPPVEPLA